MNYFYYALAIFAGFLITLFGSVNITGSIQGAIYGPYPFDGKVPLVRTLTDFFFSFGFTVLGGYAAARITTSNRVLVALSGGMAYFVLSAYWYSGYGLTPDQWIVAIITLIKVPIAAYLGAKLYQKYSMSAQESADT